MVAPASVSPLQRRDEKELTLSMKHSISEKPTQHTLNFEASSVLKRCCTCEQSLPATNEYFNVDHRAPSGFASQCRQCRRIKRRKTPLPEVMEEGQKRCTRCKEVFPATLDFFSRHKKGLEHIVGHVPIHRELGRSMQ